MALDPTVLARILAEFAARQIIDLSGLSPEQYTFRLNKRAGPNASVGIRFSSAKEGEELITFLLNPFIQRRAVITSATLILKKQKKGILLADSHGNGWKRNDEEKEDTYDKGRIGVRNGTIFFQQEGDTLAYQEGEGPPPPIFYLLRTAKLLA